MSYAARGGFALLLALAVCVLVLASLATWMRARHHLGQVSILVDTDERCRSLRTNGETLLLSWIGHADQIVLPPEGGSVLVCDEIIHLPDASLRVSVRAYDGCAALPAARAIPGDALLTAAPAGLRRVRGPRQVTPAGTISGWIDEVPLDTSVRRFPAWAPGAVSSWSIPEAPAGRVGAPDPAPAQDDRPALAVWICPHQGGRLNLNTAPISLLQEAYRELRLDGIEELERRRRTGATSEPPNQPGDADLRLDNVSQVWNARIDVFIGDLHRAWWVVAVGNRGPFRIIQRHAIPPDA